MFFRRPKKCVKCSAPLGRVFYEVLSKDPEKNLYCAVCATRLRKEWAKDGQGFQVEESPAGFQSYNPWLEKIIFFPIWFPFWFLRSLGRSGREIEDLYKKWGFVPYAIELIFIGIVLLICRYLSSSEQMVIAVIGSWSLLIGVVYFLFRVFLMIVRKIAEAVKIGTAKARLPVQESSPPKARLLRLEELRKDGLLTDAEYQGKREEILGEV